MSPVLLSAQNTVTLVLGAAAFALMAWALVDCLRARADAFPAAGKRTKQFWLLLTGVATAIGFVSMTSPLNIFNLAAVIAAAVYLTDVRPAVRTAIGRGGSGGRMGPYGPW